MAIAGRKSEGAWGYGPNGRGPRSQRGGQYDGVGKVVSHFPCLTLVFVQTVFLQTVQTVRALVRRAVLSYPCSLFFSFFPFHPNLSAATSSSSPPPPCLALIQAISRRHHLDTTTTAPTSWPLQPPPRHPLRGAKYPLHSPSHASRAHTSRPATVALTVPSAP